MSTTRINRPRGIAIILGVLLSVLLALGVNVTPARAADPVQPDYQYSCTVDGTYYTVTYSPMFTFDEGDVGRVVLEPPHEGLSADATAIVMTDSITGFATDTVSFDVSRFAGTLVPEWGWVQIETHWLVDPVSPSTMPPYSPPIYLSGCTDVSVPVLETLDSVGVKTSPGRVTFANPVTNPTINVAAAGTVITIAPGKSGSVKVSDPVVTATVTADGYETMVLPEITMPAKGGKGRGRWL